MKASTHTAWATAKRSAPEHVAFPRPECREVVGAVDSIRKAYTECQTPTRSVSVSGATSADAFTIMVTSPARSCARCSRPPHLTNMVDDVGHLPTLHVCLGTLRAWRMRGSAMRGSYPCDGSSVANAFICTRNPIRCQWPAQPRRHSNDLLIETEGVLDRWPFG